MYCYSYITMHTYDKANQLVSSTTDGKVTEYAYDAAGRLIKEGDKSYSYGWLDKVLSVTENGKPIASFNYHNDGQIAQAIHNGKSEDFLWDSLALIHRGETSFINEPYVTGGNPILSSKDGVMFNDMLGSTLNIGGKAVNMTAFGESTDTNAMYTGKPYIGELGYAFLFRNYRSDYGKWQTTDPLGYPDGWNNLAYCNNKANICIDLLGLTDWIRNDNEPYVVGRIGFKYAWGVVNFEPGGWFLAPLEDWIPNFHRFGVIHDAWVDALIAYGIPDWIANIPTMRPSYVYALTLNFYDTGKVALGYSIDTGKAIYNYYLRPAYLWTDTHIITPVEYGVITAADWTIDTANDITNLFNLMISRSQDLFNEAYNYTFSGGFLE